MCVGFELCTQDYIYEEYPECKEFIEGAECFLHIPESSFKPKIYDPTLIDQIVEVRTEDVYQMVRDLARKEGLFVGISSGAAALAAYQVAKELDQGVVVTIFPDAGYKYLSDESLWGER